MASPAMNTVAGAFVVGLLTSLHCATMCGPLLCAALPKPSLGYHFGRMISYTTLGAVAGALGMVPLQKLMKSPLIALPWMLVLLLVAIIIGWKPRLPKPLFLRKFTARWTIQHGPAKGFMLGLITPLLPCAPLYLMLAACLVAGSASLGGQFAFSFTLGTMPLLWLSHVGWGQLRLKLSPQRLRIVQRSVALIALVMVVWRLQTLHSEAAEPKCPMCAAAEGMP